MRASRPFGSGSGKSFKSGRLLLAADAAALSQKEQYEEEPNESSDVEARRPRRTTRAHLVSHSDVDEYLEEKTSGRSGSSMELPPIGELSRADVAPRRAPTARRTGEDSHLPSLAPTRAPTARRTGEEV